MSLLEPDEPQPVHVERADSGSPFVIGEAAGQRAWADWLELLLRRLLLERLGPEFGG